MPPHRNAAFATDCAEEVRSILESQRPNHLRKPIAAIADDDWHLLARRRDMQNALAATPGTDSARAAKRSIAHAMKERAIPAAGAARKARRWQVMETTLSEELANEAAMAEFRWQLFRAASYHCGLIPIATSDVGYYSPRSVSF